MMSSKGVERERQEATVCEVKGETAQCTGHIVYRHRHETRQEKEGLATYNHLIDYPHSLLASVLREE